MHAGELELPTGVNERTNVKREIHSRVNKYLMALYLYNTLPFMSVSFPLTHKLAPMFVHSVYGCMVIHTVYVYLLRLFEERRSLHSDAWNKWIFKTPPIQNVDEWETEICLYICVHTPTSVCMCQHLSWLWSMQSFTAKLVTNDKRNKEWITRSMYCSAPISIVRSKLIEWRNSLSALETCFWYVGS